MNSNLLRTLCLAILLPVLSNGAGAAPVVFEFESTCTDFIRHTDCSYFGLSATDTVSGGFVVEDQYGAPGAISWLSNDQYQLIFQFGNQAFSEQDAISVLGFNVTADGSGFSSIIGTFENQNGAVLTFLTLTTVNIALSGYEADTFGGSGRWALAEGSDLFTSPVPLPPAQWLMALSLSLLGLRSRWRAARFHD